MQRELLGAPVRVGPAPFVVPEPTADDSPWLQSSLRADERRAILTIDGVATFAVADGRSVTVQPEQAADERIVEAFLNSTVAAVLLAQRDRFALHANCVRIGRSVLLIAGRSGSGKSTTSARLIQRGHTPLADDLCLLDPQDTSVMLHPTERRLRLLPASARELEFDISEAAAAHDGTEKVTLPLPLAAATPVDSIVILLGEAETFAMRQVRGAEAMRHLHAQVYRIELLGLIWPARIFDWAARVAAQLPIFTLARSPGWTVDQVADALEDTLS